MSNSNSTHQNSPNVNDQNYEQNRYIFARQAWDERYGDLITRTRNWRLAFFLAMGVAIILAAGMVSLSHRAHLVPYVVQVDKLGRIAASGTAEEASKIDPSILRQQLSEWLQRLRSVTSDAQVEQSNIDHVYAMLQQHSEAFPFLNDYFRGHNPFTRGQKSTTTVEVHSVLSTSDKTWELTWTETERDEHGEIQSTKNFTGALTVGINPPTEEQPLNPLGIYVYRVVWSQVV
jgi:type IV secretory pathway TrbF-like protein